MKTALETICKAPAGGQAGLSSPRILVVDDDEGLRQTNQTALTISGYQVDSAEDGESAWNALQTNHYDLLITDNNMPRLSGLELIRRLRSRQITLPIILASGSLRAAMPDEARLPAVTMLPKPYEMTELLEAVRNNLSSVPQPAPTPAGKPIQVEFKNGELFSAVPDMAGIYTVERYSPDRKREWDGFLSEAKNATFLFNRDYMDYHSDRFTDHSLMVFCDQKMVGLLPANLNADHVLISHEGLTYGGLLVSRAATTKVVLASFHALLEHLNREGIFKLLYKRIPAFYNPLPDDEVGYALFLLDARLFRRDCSATIRQGDRLPVGTSRMKLIKKAVHHGVRIVQETSFQSFWERVLTPQLAARYGVKPVHSLDEITMLASRFPEHIKQFSAYCEDEIVAGTTIYETPTVAHAQYGAVTEKGRQLGAQAHLFNSLIERYQNKRFFDFGISNEQEGRALNHGLLEWKEGFGARCYAHDFYEIATANYPKLEPVLYPRADAPRAIRGLAQTFVPAPGLPLNQTCFRHPQALIDEGAAIGRRTRIWAFAHISRNAVIGDDCNICDHTFIEDGVRIGNRVTVKCGVFLWDGVTAEDDVFIGPNATFTNDYRPRSKRYLKQPLQTLLQEGCTLGAHSTTLPGLRIGRWAMVGAGSVVTHDVPDYGLVLGAPARLRGWVCRCGKKLSSDAGPMLACHCGRHYEQFSDTEIRETNLFSPAITAGLACR